MAGASETPPYITQLVERVAARYPAIRYDAHDPHRAAIEAAARRHGLVLCPSATIQPRSIHGTEMPDLIPVTPDEAATAVGDPAAARLWDVCAAHGWMLVRQPGTEQADQDGVPAAFGDPPARNLGPTPPDLTYPQPPPPDDPATVRRRTAAKRYGPTAAR